MGAFEGDLESMLGAGEAARPKAQRAHALVVAGMHRTGTSATTRVLGLLGIDLPRHPVPAMPNNNDLGFWESVPISEAHDRFLASIGSAWDDVSPIPASVFASARADSFAEELAGLVTAEYGDSSLFVIKDPRLCRLIPIWASALDRVGARPSFVITTRNPLEVAASLKERDGFSATKSCILWLRHLLDAERGSRGFPRVFLSYEQLLRDWVGTTDRIASELRLFWPRADHDAHLQVDEFLSSALRHHSFDYSELRARSDVTEWVKQAYDAVARATADAGQLDSELFDELTLQLDRADQAYGPLLAQARATLAEHDAAGAEAQAQLEQVADELAERQAELDKVSADNSSVTARLVEEIGATAQLARILDGVATALAGLGDGLGSLTANVVVGKREPNGLRAELALLLDELNRRPTAGSEPTALASAFGELSRRIADFLELVDDDRASLLATLAEHEALVAHGAGGREELEAQVREVTAALGDREAALADALLSVEAANAEVVARDEEASVRATELNELTAESARLTNAVAKSEESLARAEARLEGAVTASAKTEQKLRARVQESERALIDATVRLEAIEAEMQTRADELRQARTERDRFAQDGLRLAQAVGEREEILAELRETVVSRDAALAEAVASRDAALAEAVASHDAALAEAVASHDAALAEAVASHDAALAEAVVRSEVSAEEVASQRDSFEQIIAQRDSAFSDVIARLATAEAGMSSTVAELNETRAERDQWAAEGVRLSGLLGERGEELDRLRFEAAELARASAERAAELEQLGAESTELAIAVAEREEALQRWVRDFEALQTDSRSVTEAFAATDASLAATATQLAAVEAQLADAEAGVEEAVEARDAARVELQRLTGLLAEREEMLREMRMQLDARETELGARVAELTEARQGWQDAEKKADERETELQQSLAERKAWLAESDRVSKVLADREETLAALLSVHESLQADAVAKTAALVEVAGQLAAVEAVAAERGEELQRAEDEIHQWVTETERLSDAINERETRLAEVVASLDVVAGAERERAQELGQALTAYEALWEEAGHLHEALAEQSAELATTRLRLEAGEVEAAANAGELRAAVAQRDDAFTRVVARLEAVEAEAEDRLAQAHAESRQLAEVLVERENALTRALDDARRLAVAVAESEEMLARQDVRRAERDVLLLGAQSELAARDELLARRWQQLDRLSADLRARNETLAMHSELLAKLDAIGRTRGRRWRTLTQFCSWLFQPTAERRGYLKAYLHLRRSDLFDADFYLSRYPDVAHAGLNPVMHFVQHGRREGRQPIGSHYQIPYVDDWSPTAAALSSITTLPDVAELFPTAPPTTQRGVAPQDADLASRLRHALGAHVPASSVVAVATGGDERLLALPDCVTCHFPRASNGGYGGDDATGDTALIANVEASRAAGADFLLVPASQRALLESNPRFRAHLSNRYWRALESDELGVCFVLFSIDSSKAWRQQLADLAEWIDRDTGREASILDWESGLQLTDEIPGCDVFSVSDVVLPHVDGSVDVVAVVTSSEERLAEAARVARYGVLEVPADGSAAHLVASASFVGNAPSVSIIIPCHEEFAHTQACVRALGETLPNWFRGEIIIVDDGSGAGTVVDLQELASSDPRIVLIRNEVNLGFLGSVNRAAKEASGEFLVLLNNDTIPLPGWLPPLIAPLRIRDDVGAVGGRLVYPDGRLQEAGGLVFRDGSAAKFGYGDPEPDFPLFLVPREVDYCSGCLLAFKREFFLESGAFDPEYGFGFYEDTDFCFRVRALGKVVLYEPESTIIHVEGASAGVDLTQGAKRFQALNASLFTGRWEKALAQQPERPPDLDRETLQRLARRDEIAETQ